MAGDSIRKLTLIAVRARLERIAPENGFRTDAGRQIFMSVRPMLGPDDPDAAIAILPEEQEIAFVAEHVRGTWPIAIIALANASENRNDPALVAEDVLADIQQAMELEDRTLGGLIRPRFEVGGPQPLERTTGTDAIGIVQPYRFPMTRGWGKPDER